MKFLIFSIFTICLSIANDLKASVRVVSTISTLGSLAKQIGGNRVRVDSLVKPGEDPHFVDPKPSYVLLLNRADLLLSVGMELEGGWLPVLVQGSRNPKILKGRTGHLDCSTIITPINVRAVDRSLGDIHPGGNPHYWIDPRNGILLARAIAQRLSAISPQDASYFQKRADDFILESENKMSKWLQKLEPIKGSNVVVFHESWTYFLDWAGLNQVGTIEPLPGIPPNPSYIAGLIANVKNQDVKYVMQESFYSSRLSRLFAQQVKAPLLILPTVVGDAKTKNYFDVIDQIVNALVN